MSHILLWMLPLLTVHGFSSPALPPGLGGAEAAALSTQPRAGTRAALGLPAARIFWW